MRQDSAKIERLLKTAKGQIDGILKMIDENRDCLEVSSQLSATQSILKKVNIAILTSHLSHCVKETFEHDDETAKNKQIEEFSALLGKLLK